MFNSIKNTEYEKDIHIYMPLMQFVRNGAEKNRYGARRWRI